MHTAQTETGNSTACHRFSGTDRQIKHRRRTATVFKHRQAMAAPHAAWQRFSGFDRQIQHRREAGHAQTGKNITAWQRFSCFDRQICTAQKGGWSCTNRKEHHSLAEVFLFWQANTAQKAQQFIHTQAGKNSTARRFPVLTGKCSTKGAVVNAQAGKESTALMTEMLLRCQASSPQIDIPILTCTWAMTGQLDRNFLT